MDNAIRRMTSTSGDVPDQSLDRKDQYNNYDSSDNGHSTLKDVSERGSVLETPGVKRMEAFARATKGRRKVLIGLALAVYVVNWVYSQEQSTTYAYAIWATSSFQQHASGISITNIATRIISAVCLPCKCIWPRNCFLLTDPRLSFFLQTISCTVLAKFADVFSRPMVYLIALVCYTVGFLVIAQSPNLGACEAHSMLLRQASLLI